MSKDVMIDIEAFGNGEDGARPFLASVGAVWFNPFNDDLENPFYVNVNHVRNGRLEYGTVKWWLKQSPEAQKALFEPAPVRADDALKQLAGHVKGAEHIWANGINYDIRILDTLYQSLGMRRPWGFRHMDMRSLKLIAGGLGWQEPMRTGVAHNALDDATYQARAVQSAVKFLKERRIEV